MTLYILSFTSHTRAKSCLFFLFAAERRAMTPEAITPTALYRGSWEYIFGNNEKTKARKDTRVWAYGAGEKKCRRNCCARWRVYLVYDPCSAVPNARRDA